MKIDPLDHRSHSSRAVAAAQRTNPRAQTPVVDKRNYIRPDARPSTAMKTNPATPRYKVPDADLYKLDRNLSERIAKASLSRVSAPPPRPVSRAESTISSVRYRPESRVNSFRPESRAGTYTVPNSPASVISSSTPLPRVRSTTPARSAAPRVPASRAPVARAQTAPKLAVSATPAVKYRVPSSALRTQLSFEVEPVEKKALVLEFALSWSGVNDVTTLCLLDPKATNFVISEQFVRESAIPCTKSGEEAEQVTTVPVILQHQKHYTRETFTIGTVDERVNAVLPAKWIEKHELVDLFGGAQYFGTASCLQNCTKTNALKDPTIRAPSPEPAPAPPALRSRKSGNLLRSTTTPAPAKRSVSGSGPVKRSPASTSAVKPSSSPPKETLRPEKKKPLPSRSPARPPPPSRTPAPGQSRTATKTPTPGKRAPASTAARSPGRRVVSGEETKIPQRKTSGSATTSPSSSATSGSPQRRAAPAPRRVVSPALSTASSEFDPNPTLQE